MENKKNGFVNLLLKLPYGIICGACAIFVFFATAGLIISYVIYSGIASQTTDTVAFLEYGWQTTLFVFDIVFALIAIACLVMFILKKSKVLFAEKAETVEDRMEKEQEDRIEEEQNESI